MLANMELLTVARGDKQYLEYVVERPGSILRYIIYIVFSLINILSMDGLIEPVSKYISDLDFIDIFSICYTAINDISVSRITTIVFEFSKKAS